MSITITFDNPSKTYWAGSIISGRIDVNLEEPKNIQNITIGFKGIQQHRRKYGIVKYFNFSVVLIEYPDESPLPPGQHTYYFQYTLPADLPPSFVSRFGDTKYRAKANMELPGGFDISTKENIFIIPIVRLDDVPEGRERFIIKAKKSIGMCYKSGDIVLAVTAPTSGFVCGEVVTICIDIQNSSDAVVYATEAKIKKVVTYVTPVPHNKKFKVGSSILTNKIDTFVEAKRRGSFNMELQIPLTEPSTMDDRAVIQLLYLMKFECKIQGWHFNFNDKKKIVIATVPLSSPSAQPVLQIVQG